MAKGKNVLTTGDVARICSVAPRTVSKWFDSGQLKGYRIPGSKDRRIPLNELVRFMKANNMPADVLSAGRIRVLIVDSNEAAASSLAEVLRDKADYEVRAAGTNFKTGLAAQKFAPHVMLINLLADNVNANEICQSIRRDEDLQTIKLIAIARNLSSSDSAALLQKGFDACITNPQDILEVVRKIEQATAIVY